MEENKQQITVARPTSFPNVAPLLFPLSLLRISLATPSRFCTSPPFFLPLSRSRCCALSAPILNGPTSRHCQSRFETETATLASPAARASSMRGVHCSHIMSPTHEINQSSRYCFNSIISTFDFCVGCVPAAQACNRIRSKKLLQLKVVENSKEPIVIGVASKNSAKANGSKRMIGDRQTAGRPDAQREWAQTGTS